MLSMRLLWHGSIDSLALCSEGYKGLVTALGLSCFVPHSLILTRTYPFLVFQCYWVFGLYVIFANLNLFYRSYS